jgi:hypothetical protein
MSSRLGVHDLSAANPEIRYPVPQSDRLQDPNTNGNHDYYVQNRLDAGGHGDKAIDQPQPNANYDQANYEIY